MFMRSILPIGLLFSGSLILSNTAYLYLSIAYIQMLKVRPAPSAKHISSLYSRLTYALTYELIGFHAGRDPSHLVD